MNIESFPLSWPTGVARTRHPSRARFGKHSIAAATKAMKQEVVRLGGTGVVLSSNLRLKNDGEPYSVQASLSDTGVTLWFQLKQVSYCLPCDQWDRVEHNIWALAKHIEAMRGMERWGVGSVAQHFSGFKALPETASVPDWWLTLEIEREAAVEEIKAAFKERARGLHPDQGGNSEYFQSLLAARNQGLAEKESYV